MVLSTEWSQVEVIDLVNDGSGLGFGIVGGRSTGVVVKSILPGGIADRDGRIQSGDHILQINDVQTRGLGSEHVATILRQAGLHVRIIVARPVEPTSCDYRALGSHAPIIPTKTLSDPEELETLLLQNGYTESFDGTSPMQEYEQSMMEAINTENPFTINILGSNYDDSGSDGSGSESPESEHIIVQLEKNSYGLGITVAGYVWEREDLSGIFVKEISKGSAVHLCGKIRLNDRIVEVDGHSLRGVTNYEAVEILRKTGKTVTLALERYLRGPRYEHLQNALQADTIRPTVSPTSPSITTLSWFPVQTDASIEPEPESHTTIDSMCLEPPDPETIEIFVDTHFESGSVTPDLDMAVKNKWKTIIGPDTEIIVAQLRKLRGLGISLEGTVDVEDGVELRPRHFIRSILPEGPVGRNGKLSSGDELLEVNGQKLLGKNHVDVVKILKELPETVRIVCARNVDTPRVINTSQDREGFEARNILSGSLRTLLNPSEAQDNISLNTSSTITLADEINETESSEAVQNVISLNSNQIVLIHNHIEEPEDIECDIFCKFDSEKETSVEKDDRSNTPLAIKQNSTSSEDSESKISRKSLEAVTYLAIWRSEIEIIELYKGSKGLGFSILDYQDPLDPNGTVIVVRSLVSNGSAELDGRLHPGDRLMSVNDISLRNVSLEEAVKALKGAEIGKVIIGFSKPMPLGKNDGSPIHINDNYFIW